MNYDMFHTINDWSGNSFLDDVMKFAAKDLLFAVFAGFALLCGQRLRDKDYRPVALAFGGLILTFVFGQIAAKVHSERRPFETHKVHQLISHGTGGSFPSDHATAAFGIALAVAVFMSPLWGGVLFVLGVWIGVARVYVGVHYPGDIAGALLVAIVGVGLMATIAHFVPTPAAPAAKPLAGRR
jgi:undecaprenyl-diphosphatase